jgi:hypothetical protein
MGAGRSAIGALCCRVKPQCARPLTEMSLFEVN